MIAIFKSHTSCLPVTVDDAFKKLNQFDGEEVGICGRWDADSPCVRELLAEGKSSIPFSWKHMFCHTSIQTICHCIGTIFYPRYAPDVNTPSGLFMKTCAHCGMKLHLGPLHTLVLTAFHLARRGCDGENLFGMLACLVCLLVNGANPLQKAHITMEALLGVDTADHCTHQDLDPFEFLKKIPRRLFSTWTENVLLGFEVFSRILQYAQEERVRVSLEAQRRRRRSNRNDFSAFIEYGDDDDEISVEDYSSDEDSEEIDDHYCSHRRPTNFYCESEDIGILWASIQTELLTYRQLKTGDPWLSENFNMQFLLNGISSGRGISIPLVNNEMMGPFCICGTFFDTLDNAGVCLRVSEVSAYHFSNVEDWDRCAFINNL
jgi:hypothetical protein